MTVVALLLLCRLNLIALVVSSCGRCLCDLFSWLLFALVAVSKSSELEGKAASSLNHLLAQDTLPKEYLLSWTSLLWDPHLKATAIVFKYLTVLEGIVAAEKEVLDQELLLLEGVCFPMGWAVWGKTSQQFPALDFTADLEDLYRAKGWASSVVRKIKLVWSHLRVRVG